MVACACVAHLARRAADYGVQTGPVSVVRRRKREIVESWCSSSERRLRADGVDLITGVAHFTGPNTVTVTLNAGGTRALSAATIVINAGACPAVPDLPGLASAVVAPQVQHHHDRAVLQAIRCTAPPR